MFLTNLTRTARSYRVEQARNRTRRHYSTPIKTPTIAVERLNASSVRDQKGNEKS